ncbi:MAG TPA: DUF2726 domain-containing protein [Ottowia sp.]|uniref:DUF2726 domain-containing protein n=1 Tax=Ottowia sp. TaxID=1898956 RepID=UPI002CD2AE1F|nr:DUF2726 domain-containing protein [Ottowia sp.]HMN22765.1 DUF2726 domain-containing protein [Ottowia sp.]
MTNPWLWPTILLLLLLALAALWLRGRAGAAPAALGPDDRFAPAVAISPAESELLDYLVRAFPGRAVLFRCPLSRMVVVRRTGRRLAAQQRLAEHAVDYTVCNREGRPVYAFELDAVHADADEAAHDAAEKHRVLKTAGIRLIRLKRSTRDLPTPPEFRRQLRAAALPPPDAAAAAADDPWQGAERARSGGAPAAEAAADPADAQDTQPMSMTDLMGLPPMPADAAAEDPWGTGRA